MKTDFPIDVKKVAERLGLSIPQQQLTLLDYGYVGRAMGIPVSVLIGGSIYAHYTDYGNFDDDPEDWEMICAGAAMAAADLRNGVFK